MTILSKNFKIDATTTPPILPHMIATTIINCRLVFISERIYSKIKDIRILAIFKHYLIMNVNGKMNKNYAPNKSESKLMTE